jgi:hypothetical protein
MSQNDNGPSSLLAKLKAQRKSLDERIAEADRKHVHALGLIIRQVGLEDRDSAFLRGVLLEAARVPKGTDRYRELTAAGSK